MNEINLKNSSFKSEIFKKKANWLDFICIYPKINQRYISNKKKIDSLGYIDPVLLYELHLIGEVDLNTLNHLVEDYSINLKSRNKKNVKLLTSKNEENEYSALKHLVKDIVDNSNESNAHPISDVKKKIIKSDNLLVEEDYTDKLNLDLLRYYLILRFLKIRDVKFWIINILNYFRFLQKKFVIDLYKIENKNWKKAEDYESLIKTMNQYPYENSIENKENCEKINLESDPEKVLIDKDIFHTVEKTNPVFPSYDIFMNIAKNNTNNNCDKKNQEKIKEKFSNLDYKNIKNLENKSQIPDSISMNSKNTNNINKGSVNLNNSIIFNEENEDKTKSNHLDHDFNKMLLDEIEERPEFSEDKKIVRLKDSKGNYIIYDATISDMDQLENELGKIGSYYIHKREELIVDYETTSDSMIDRSQILLDLFTKEFEFLYAKFELVNQLLFCYDNITDIIMQKSLIQMITDLIAQRPLLDLNFYYFNENYILETENLKKKTSFLKKLIYHQIKIEIEEIKLIHEKNDKLYWLMGECALDLIMHIRLEKCDIHLLKENINSKRNELKFTKNQSLINNNIMNNMENKNEGKNDNQDQFLEIEKFINIFEKMMLHKDLFNNEDKKEDFLIKIEETSSNKKNSKQNEIVREEELIVDREGNFIISSTSKTTNQEKIYQNIEKEKILIKEKEKLSENENLNNKEISIITSKKTDIIQIDSLESPTELQLLEKESSDLSELERLQKIEANKKRINEMNLLNEMEILEIEALEKSENIKTSDERKEINKFYESHKSYMNLKKLNSESKKFLKNPTEEKEKFDDNQELLEDKLQSENNNLNFDKEESKVDKKSEKILCELNIILKFLKKLFSQTIIQNCENPENNQNIFNLNYYSTSDIKISEEEWKKISDLDLIENYEPLRKFLNQNNIPLGENPNQSRRFYSLYPKASQNANNNLTNNIDILNFQVRSLLNIPYPFKDPKDKNLVETNSTIIESLKEDISFYQFTEGFPMKILSEYKNEDFLNKEEDQTCQKSHLKNFDFFESLSILIPTYTFMAEGLNEIKKNFKSENFLSEQSIELCLLENYINCWGKYKEYINGNIKNTQFETLLFLNNSLLNNPENMMYIVRNLTATLSDTINRIPPQLIAKLPISILEKMEIDMLEFKNPDDNIKVINLENIENIKLEELNRTLIQIVSISKNMNKN